MESDPNPYPTICHGYRQDMGECPGVDNSYQKLENLKGHKLCVFVFFYTSDRVDNILLGRGRLMLVAGAGLQEEVLQIKDNVQVGGILPHLI